MSEERSSEYDYSSLDESASSVPRKRRKDDYGSMDESDRDSACSRGDNSYADRDSDGDVDDGDRGTVGERRNQREKDDKNDSTGSRSGNIPILAPDVEEEISRKTVKSSGDQTDGFNKFARGISMSRRSIKEWIDRLPKVDSVLAEPPVLQRRLRADRPLFGDVSERDMICLHDLLYASLNMLQLTQQDGLDVEESRKFSLHSMKMTSVAIMIITGVRRRAATKALNVKQMHGQFSRVLDGKAHENEGKGDKTVHHLFPVDIDDQIKDDLRDKKSASVYGYVFYFNYGRKELDLILPIPGKQWTKFMYLTFCNLSMQFLYHSVGSVLALLSPNENDDSITSRIMKTFHFYAVSVSFPVATTVVTLFWSLYHISPDILLTPADKVVLSVTWYNHAIHSLPLLSMLLDFIAWRHPQPIVSESFKALTIFGIVYLVDIHILKYITNVWPYPIIGHLNIPSRIGFFGLCSTIFITNYFIGYGYNSLLSKNNSIKHN